MIIATERSLYRFRRSEEGATAVEAALVILVFVLLIFGLVQFAEIFWTWNTMILALGEGGRYAMVYNPTNFPNGPPASSCSVASPTLAKCAVAQANAALTTYPSLSVTVSCTAGCTGTPATSDSSRNFYLRLRRSAIAALRACHDDPATYGSAELTGFERLGISSDTTSTQDGIVTITGGFRGWARSNPVSYDGNRVLPPGGCFSSEDPKVDRETRCR